MFCGTMAGPWKSLMVPVLSRCTTGDARWSKTEENKDITIPPLALSSSPSIYLTFESLPSVTCSTLSTLPVLFLSLPTSVCRVPLEMYQSVELTIYRPDIPMRNMYGIDHPLMHDIEPSSKENNVLILSPRKRQPRGQTSRCLRHTGTP